MTQPVAVADELSWRSEAVVALWVAAFSAILGQVAGLVWSALAVHTPYRALFTDAAVADKQLIGQDLTFGYVVATAAVIAVALLLWIGRQPGLRGRILGPGASLGLVAGGVAGSVVANAVGQLQRDPPLIAALDRLGPQLPAATRTLELAAHQFELRAAGLLMVWPLVAVLVHLAAVSRAGSSRSVVPAR